MATITTLQVNSIKHLVHTYIKAVYAKSVHVILACAFTVTVHSP